MKVYIVVFLIMFLLGIAGGYFYWNKNSILMRIKGVHLNELSYSRVESSGMVLSFKTQKPVTTKVHYGTTPLYGVETSEKGPTTEHSYYIDGLLPGKENNFSVEIKTEDGKVFKTENKVVSGEVK